MEQEHLLVASQVQPDIALNLLLPDTAPDLTQPDISIVIPCYNEGEHLLHTVETLAGFFEVLNRKYEIIVSDDGSVDMTSTLNWPKYSSEFCARYIRSNSNTGKGGALKRGLLACRGKFVFFTDADLPVGIEAFAVSLDLLERNECDIVIGDRTLAYSTIIGSGPLHRRVASKLFNAVAQLVVLRGYPDTQCCMKAFATDALQKILPATFLTSYAFDAELLYLATSHHLRIKRVPVIWRDVRAHLSAKHFIFLSFSCVKDVVSIRLRSRHV